MLTTLAFASATVLVVAWHLRRQGRLEREALELREANARAGLKEPPSLHPVVDLNQCIGCASCVEACPEKTVLGIIGGKAELVEPTRCIGHGACKTACPTQAIRLVFGTETRGIDIPNVAPDFQTNVPGLFIAGELGGMGLIGNAIEQGRQAMESIAELSGIGGKDRLDVVVVGAGPAGFSASLAAMERRLRAVTVEQDSLGGTVAHFPRGKIVMTRPVSLPLVGRVRFSETSKEKLLEFWQGVRRKTGVAIRFGERVDAIERDGDGFRVRTTKGVYRSRAVLLAIGRRGTPRTLGVPGEEKPKVAYRLIDPEQYAGRAVLVVGGGDSALEAAASIAEVAGTRVTLSYRDAAFARAKPKNRARIEEAAARGRVSVLYQSNVKAIRESSVEIDRHGQAVHVPNDAVIICAGGILPTAFLQKIGVEVETKYGTA